MRKIVIAGGTGFLGSLLTNYFTEKGDEVFILTRMHQLDKKNIHYVQWDATSQGPWSKVLERSNVLINLTGKSVDCRYNEYNKQMIYHSRIDATNALGKAVRKLKHPPRLWINAASATIYRHALDRDMDEETGDIGEGFSVDVCKKWEEAFHQFELTHTRKVVLRIAIVLAKKGGALAPLKTLVRVGMGGKQGRGNQYFSWLHEEDFVRLVEYVIQNENIQGVYNAAAPNPVPNHQLMKELRKVLRMPFGLNLPKWLLEFGAVIIDTETELILKSRRVVPRRLMEAGFEFRFTTIEDALKDLVE